MMSYCYFYEYHWTLSLPLKLQLLLLYYCTLSKNYYEKKQVSLFVSSEDTIRTAVTNMFIVDKDMRLIIWRSCDTKHLITEAIADH